MLGQFIEESLKAEDVPLVFEQKTTKMYDDLWVEQHLEEEEIFNDFFDHKCPFNTRYIEIRDASWRRLAKKFDTLALPKSD